MQVGVDFRGDRLGAIRFGDPTELAQQVLDRQIRRGTAIGQTMPFTVGHRSIAQTLAEFVEQPRLADAGLARDAEHLSLSLGGMHQALVQHRQLPLAPDEPTQGASPMPQHPRPPLRDAAHLVHRPRGRSSRYPESPPVVHLDLCLHQLLGGGAKENGAGCRLLPQLAGPLDGLAHRGIQLVALRAQAADHH